MRIENIVGDGTWNTLSIPPDSSDFILFIQHSSTVDTEVRLEDNPTETWTIKSGDVGMFNITPRQTNQVAVNAAGGTIQARYESLR